MPSKVCRRDISVPLAARVLSEIYELSIAVCPVRHLIPVQFLDCGNSAMVAECNQLDLYYYRGPADREDRLRKNVNKLDINNLSQVQTKTCTVEG